MIGRVEFTTKNSVAALDTLQASLRRGFSANLKVVGDGPNLAQLRMYAQQIGVQDKVTFRGWQRDAWESVGSEDVVLIPSVYEGGVTLVAIEAMTRGIRVVTSPLPTFQEGVPKECIAIDFSGEGLADQVQRVLKLSVSEMQALYITALSKFSAEEFVGSFLALCNGQISVDKLVSSADTEVGKA